MTLQNKVLAPSLCVTPAAFERPAQAGQIIEISRVGPGTTQRERSGETDCDERDDGWGIIRPGASHELDSFTRAEIIHTNMTMLSWHHRGDSITEPWQCPSCVRLCLLSLDLDSPKERVTRQPALVILGSWSLFSLAMIWETMNSVEFTLARVLEDYHKNPLCHHSKLNAVFKSSQRFLQNKNEPGSQSSRSYSIHSFSNVIIPSFQLVDSLMQGLCSD